MLRRAKQIIPDGLQCESKNPPEVLWHFQTVENF